MALVGSKLGFPPSISLSSTLIIAPALDSLNPGLTSDLNAPNLRTLSSEISYLIFKEGAAKV